MTPSNTPKGCTCNQTGFEWHHNPDCPEHGYHVAKAQADSYAAKTLGVSPTLSKYPAPSEENHPEKSGVSFYGRPVEEMTRPQLLKCVTFLAAQYEKTLKERDKLAAEKAAKEHSREEVKRYIREVGLLEKSDE